ncbi:MAG: hypothetical protein IPP10_04475 [Candidatus Competibacteraceae bacterium]|nr:hypothetical protein [Candidatus Competibacteraceae bacterium]MBK7983700.1 hypothetical protein [Candidatus Competibacteraceae bacterium]MBK8897758.1 hypothetical protein [Candidatus Competibacteraceae bacterium]MBK8961564.1 hypothetical protein [Candidatus Competibacteraceae bacterium]MBK9950789.1 hypothetical protein [Candidatus Competibacteraceae bacterium]
MIEHLLKHGLVILITAVVGRPDAASGNEDTGRAAPLQAEGADPPRAKLAVSRILHAARDIPARFDIE